MKVKVYIINTYKNTVTAKVLYEDNDIRTSLGISVLLMKSV